jgi:hypothetical protein
MILFYLMINFIYFYKEILKYDDKNNFTKNKLINIDNYIFSILNILL